MPPGSPIKTPYPYIILMMVPLFWAGNWVIAPAILERAGPGFITAARWTAAALILLPGAMGAGPVPRSPRAWGAFALAGILGIGYTLLQYESLRYTTPLNGSLIFSMSPIITALLTAVLLRERLSLSQYAGAAITFVGAAIVLSGGDMEALAGLRLNRGDVMMLIAAAMWAGYSVQGRALLKRYTPESALAWAAAAVLPFLWAYALWETAGMSGINVRWADGAGIIYMALFASVLAYRWWNRGIRTLGPEKTTVFGNLLPVYTAALSFFVYGDPIFWSHIAGGAAVAAGVWLTVAHRPGSGTSTAPPPHR